jgi:predicted phosphohydrolase
LDFCDLDNRLLFYARVKSQNPDAVIITGDISNGNTAVFLRQIFDKIRVPVYFVLGNHDYYTHRIDKVREEMMNLCDVSGYCGDLFYLPQVDSPIELAPGVALVGVDGWADGGYGNWIKSTVWLSDYELIRDLVPHAHTRVHLQAKLREIAGAEAAKLRHKLEMALPVYKTVIVATHVPPFAEAAWHEGKQSAWDFLPHFASKFVGDVISEMVLYHGHQRTLVLCGHTHGVGQCQPEYGLRVWTGGAEYRNPSIAAVMEVTTDTITTTGTDFTSF